MGWTTETWTWAETILESQNTSARAAHPYSEKTGVRAGFGFNQAVRHPTLLIQTQWTRLRIPNISSHIDMSSVSWNLTNSNLIESKTNLWTQLHRSNAKKATKAWFSPYSRSSDWRPPGTRAGGRTLPSSPLLGFPPYLSSSAAQMQVHGPSTKRPWLCSQWAWPTSSSYH